MKADSFRISLTTPPTEIGDIGVNGYDLFEQPEVVLYFMNEYGIDISKDGILARLQVIVENDGQGKIGFIEDDTTFCDLVYGVYDSMGYNTFKKCYIEPDSSITINSNTPYVVNLIIHQK